MFPEYVRRCCPSLNLLGRFPRTLNRNDACIQHLEVSPDNLSVSYIGRGRDDTEAAAIRADASIPPHHLPLFYFEVRVVHRGRDGYLSLGLMTARSPLDKLVGWETESLGYHGDDGFLFRGNSGQGDEFGPEWGQDDTVGCGVDFVDQRAFFVKNGVLVNYCDLPKVGGAPWYPAMGLRTPGERLKLNFLGPFEYDILAHLSRKSYKLAHAVSLSHAVTEPQVQDLVLLYLLYHGYEESFFRYLQDSNCHNQKALVDNMNVRTYFEEKRMQREVFRLIDMGEIGHLRTLLETSFPKVFKDLTVQLVLAGVDLLEVAFTPGHDLKLLISKATQLQSCYGKKSDEPKKCNEHKKCDEHQSLFEVFNYFYL